MKNYFNFILAALISQSLSAGVVVLIDDLPREIAEFVKKEQDSLQEKIKNLNGEEGTPLAFEPSQFQTHFSLAFVSRDEISVAEIEKKLPGLVNELHIVSQEFQSTDISDTFKNLTSTYWPGKVDVLCGGSKKKNYLNAVLKATPHPVLIQITHKIREMLQEKYAIEQLFPFSLHLTLGRIYHQNDSPLSAELVNAFMLNPLTIQGPEMEPLLLNKFKLKGHDGSEEVFELSTN